MPQKELTNFPHRFFIYSEDNNRADCRKRYEATCPLKQWLNHWSFDKYSSHVGFTSEILKLLKNLNMFLCSLCSKREHCVLESGAEVIEQSSMPSQCHCPPWENFNNGMYNRNNLNWVDLEAWDHHVKLWGHLCRDLNVKESLQNEK